MSARRSLANGHDQGSKLISMRSSVAISLSDTLDRCSIKSRAARYSCQIIRAKSFVPRIDKQADQSGDALGMRGRLAGLGELGGDLVMRQPRRHLVRLEIGRDHRERIMVRDLAGRRAR